MFQNLKPKRGSALEPLLHSEHIVTIEKLVVGGDGLARLDFNGQSVVVFVPRTAPADQVKIKITATEKNHLLGEVLELVTASTKRQTPPCEYYEKCGGCNWQHVEISEQIRQKENILSDLFKKFLPDVEFNLLPTVSTSEAFHYRNRIQLKQLDQKLGYFQRGTHQIIDIQQCLLAEKALSEQITPLKNKLRPSKEIRKFELRLNHELEFESYPIGEDGEGLSFSQVNRFVNEKLVAEVVQILLKTKPQFLTELYSGAGNFTFEAAKQLPNLKIEAVELNSKLTQFAVQKLTSLQLQKRLFYFTSDCESFVNRRDLSPDFVLLDPPRAGCSEQVLEALLRAKPSHIVYVSCHPVHLARDLKKLLQNSTPYTIQHLQIFDMFPQTDHFETLVWLQRRET